MEGASQAVVAIWSEVVAAQDFLDAQAGFDLWYLHVDKIYMTTYLYQT